MGRVLTRQSAVRIGPLWITGSNRHKPNHSTTFAFAQTFTTRRFQSEFEFRPAIYPDGNPPSENQIRNQGFIHRNVKCLAHIITATRRIGIPSIQRKKVPKGIARLLLDNADILRRQSISSDRVNPTQGVNIHQPGM